MTKSNVSVGWGPRAESVDQSANRLARLLPDLAAVDPALSGWRNLGGSKRQATAQPVVTTDDTELTQRLLDGRMRTDESRQVIEDLGYRVSWWNGADDARAAAKIMIHIGSSSLGNSVVLNLPDPKVTPRLYTPVAAQRILEVFVDLFAPDSIVWTNFELSEKQREPDRPSDDGRGYILGQLIGHPAGWANYLSDSEPVKFDAALLPENATAKSLGAGTLVLVGDDPAAPPLHEVLQVRRAMGYIMPDQAETSGDASAASAASAGPTASAGPHRDSPKSAQTQRLDAPGDEAPSALRADDD